MKWLVKTLDSLLPYATEEESKSEQTNLESLIARYKNLIPTIEITMTKTEVFSKCFTYRREVHEIVCLLDKVKDQTVSAPPPESLENLRHLIQEQQFAVNQLDHQRTHIMSMLQRGRDLSKDVHAPTFVSNEIKHLENGWNDAYNETIDKLREYKNTETIWNDFHDQKTRINHLLGNAETELRSITPLQTDPKNVNLDLKHKRELNATLQQASRQMISNLHELCSELTPLTDPTKKPLIEKEVTELEKRFFNTIETVKDRVTYLEDYNTRWNNYKTRVSDLQNWALVQAPQLIEAVQSQELSPEERVIKTEALQAVISERMRALDILASDASELAPKEGNVSEAKRLRSEVSKLQEMLSLINRNVNHQVQVTKEDLSNWQKYQAGIQEIKPWIERSESKFSLINEKPINLENALHLQQQAREFAIKCEAQQGKLSEISSINNLMSCKTNAPDELDAVQSRWYSVQDNAKQNANKYDRLVSNWQSFDDDANKLEEWINRSEQAILTRPPVINTPQIDKLETELIKLKSFNNDLSEQQAKLVSLTQSSENLAPNLAPEGVNHIKNRIGGMRAKVTRLSEVVRAKINDVSDAIISRQDFNAQLANFSNSLDRLRNQTAQVEEMSNERVEPGLNIVHTLLQEHSEMRPAFSSIYEEVKNLTLSATPEDGRAINDSYTALVLNYQNLEDDLQQKKQSLEKWSEFLSWRNEMESTANYIKQQLDKSDKLGLEPMKIIINEIQSSIQAVSSKKPDAAQIDNSPVVHLRDLATGKPLIAQQIVNDFENKLHNLQLKAQNQIAALSKMEEKKNRFIEIENRLGKHLAEMKNDLDRIVALNPDVNNVEKMIIELNSLNNNLQQDVPLKDQMHNEGSQLMREDIANMPAIQESILVLNKRWDEIQEEITTQIQKYTLINQCLKDYIAAKKRFDAETQKAQDIYNSIEPAPQGEQQLLLTAGKSKNALEQIKKSKSALDDMEHKGGHLAKLFETIEHPILHNVGDEMKQSHAKWQQLHDQIAKNAQLYETEAIIWNQIEELKSELLPWLDETIQSLDDAANNTIEIEYGPIRLNKYRTELPTYASIHNDINDKINELTTINEGAEIPALTDLKQALVAKFEVAEENAQNLSEVSLNFEEQEKELRAAIKKCGDAINKIREGIVKCDDMSGDNNIIVQRLQQCQSLKGQLEDQENDLDNLRMRVDEMKTTYPTFAESIIPKELNNVQKRLDAITIHSNKVENSLSQFLKKFHNDKIGMLKRLIGAQKEKIVWCIPEPSSDKYNLEVKKASIVDVHKGIQDCLARKDEIEASIGTMNEIDSPENVEAIRSIVEGFNQDLAELQQKYEATEVALGENIILWNQYDDQTEAVSGWLKDIENKVKNESAAQVDLGNIDDKINELMKYDQEIKEHKPQIGALEKISDAIMQKNYEARVGQVAKHIVVRYQAVGKNVASLLDRVNATKKTFVSFAKNESTCNDWLHSARLHLNELARMGSPGSGPTRAQLELVKAFVGNLPNGQSHINDLVNSAEALYPVVTPDDRDRIRNKVRQLRENYDNIHDEANSLLSQVETLLIQKTSIEESYMQVKQWLDGAKNKIDSQSELYPTLTEKKAALQKLRSQLQDNSLQRNALKQLNEKAQSLADIEAVDKVNEAIKTHDDLNQTLSRRVAACESHVSNHESYDQVVERAQDCLKGLQSQTVDILNDNAFEKDGADDKLKTLENVIAERKHGDKIINACKNQLEKVLVETHPSGHPALINAFENVKRDWESHMRQCEVTQDKLKNLYSQWNAANENMDDIDRWLKGIENVVKDQSMKSTCEAKQAHLNKLQELNETIGNKGPEIATLINEVKDIEGENDINTHVSRLNTRYQTLKNQCKEGIAKYELYTKNHRSFNDDYDKFKQQLQKAIADLNENNEVVGELPVLQARQNALREISEQRANDASTFEDLIDRGEKLYVNTNPEGRELIRQQLRTLRTDWDRFSDDLNSASQKIEQCLLQFSDFAAGQEQLTKWLKDVEKAMQNHTELKTTLQEKRAQLQNHKLMNEDILNHNLLVDTVCDKAQTLVDETQDASLNAYLHSIKQLFASIVEKSQDLLTNLDGCVQSHQNFNNQTANLKGWLNGEKQKLVECEDVFGEKADIKRKLAILDQLKANKDAVGQKVLDDLREQAEIVKKCTSPKGNELIDRELAELESDFNNHFLDVDANKAKLAGVLQKWDDFDKELDELTKWCRATEAIFRDQPLQSTIDEKSKHFALFKEYRDEIVQKQKAIDSFTDRVHDLLNNTGAERLKTLTSQLTNRYQLLQTLSKEVVNRWQSILEDHRKYDAKLAEVNAWLEPLEKELELALKDSTETQIANALEHLINESGNAEALLASLDAFGEKALPETSTQGRESIRNEMRNAHDRWDRLIEEIRKQQKKQEAQTLQLSSYQDFLQQSLAWLEINENGIAQENPNTWTSIQEIRSKLLKYKTVNQDIISHKRIIEALNDKANAILQNATPATSAGAIKNTIKDINSRYEKLNQNCNDLMSKLDDALDVYQKFNDLQKYQLDYQKGLWDRLNSFTDYSGGKNTLQERLAKIDEIQSNLNEGDQKLADLSKHIDEKASVIPVRCKEVMARDLSGLKVDFDKFKDNLQDVRTNLKNRLQQWNDFESNLDYLVDCLNEAENSLRNFAPKNTLDEKQEQLEKFQVSDQSFIYVYTLKHH